MEILVINCGSSSLKYQLIDMDNETAIAQGLVERIGIEGSILTQKVPGREKYIIQAAMNDHEAAIKTVIAALTDEACGVINSMYQISAVGHRVAHAGERYSSSVLINDEVIEAIEECIKLAPLHNPANIIGINVCRALMPDIPMVAVFDTAFHQTMPEEAFLYALPYELYKEHKIRRYGFHGTSHKFVSSVAARLIGRDIEDLKLITCHLGNGASVAAIKNGKSVDTSMGFTPLEGLAMGTRSGDMDPAIIKYLMEELNLPINEVNDILNKKSGVLGVSGVSSDFRDIEAEAENGDKRAMLALNVFYYRVKKYIGSYIAAMGGVDAIIFTAGLGENSPKTREAVCSNMEFFGVKLDLDKNKVRGKITEISSNDSRIRVFLIPTNEELVIARETKEII